jgi:CDI immunity proteins
MNSTDPRRSRTLEELDGDRWGDPADDATGLMRDCYRLRTVPVAALTLDDLRLLLSQRIGAEWLIPVALGRLAEASMVGEPNPGDLLRAVLRVGPVYWADHPDQALRLWAVRAALEELRSDVSVLLDSDAWPAFG